MPSKRRTYLLAPLAERDLEEIWLFTYRNWSLEQADEYHSSIIDGIAALASGRRRGRDAGDIRKGYRKQSIGRHLVFYHERDDAIVVVRVLHQNMDISARIGSGPGD